MTGATAMADPSGDRGFAGHRTANRAVEILLAADPRYRLPTKVERKALLVGFAMNGKALVGAAFDAVRLERNINLGDATDIAANLDAITICEVKSTNRASVRSDLRGYFFNITASELLTAQTLGERYRFVFVSVVTSEHQELSLAEVMGRARAMYPAWHIRF